MYIWSNFRIINFLIIRH